MAKEFSFDVASEVNKQEVVNALDQTRREIRTRYDFKGSKCEVLQPSETVIELTADDDYRLKAVIDILKSKLIKRGISLKSLIYGKVDSALGGLKKQRIEIKNGLTKEEQKEIVKLVKGASSKAQAQMQEDIVRVKSKSKDVLQQIMQFLKKQELSFYINFINFR